MCILSETNTKEQDCNCPKVITLLEKVRLIKAKYFPDYNDLSPKDSPQPDKRKLSPNKSEGPLIKLHRPSIGTSRAYTKNFKCNQCDDGYYEKEHLSTHNNQVHGGNLDVGSSIPQEPEAITLESEQEIMKLRNNKFVLEEELGTLQHSLDEAQETLECPVCMESMEPPTRIWMCPASHLVCELCKNKLQGRQCPTCRSKKVTLRAIMAEKFAQTVFNKQKGPQTRKRKRSCSETDRLIDEMVEKEVSKRLKISQMLPPQNDLRSSVNQHMFYINDQQHQYLHHQPQYLNQQSQNPHQQPQNLNQQPQNPLYLQPKNPLYQQPPNPLYQELQNPFYQEPQNPLYQQPQNPLYQELRNPLYLEPRFPFYQEPQNPLYQQPQNPLYQQPKNPLYQQPQNPLYQQPQNPLYQQPLNPLYQQTQNPLYQQPQNPLYQQPQNPLYQQTQNPLYQQPQNPLYQQPQNPLYQQPQNPLHQLTQNPLY